MKFKLLVLLSSVSVMFAAGPDVIGSDEPVHATVGDDVVLPCHLEPPFDVRSLTVDWKCNKSFVHVYRNRRDYLEDQDKNYRGRTSLFRDELVKGNISLKLTNVTERDTGEYICFVPKLDSRVRGSTNLIVEPPRERTKGHQTNNTSHDTDPPPMNADVVITVITVVTAVLVGFGIILFSLLWPIFRGHRGEYNLVPGAGQDRGGAREENEPAPRPGPNSVDEHEMVQRAGNVQPGQDGGGPEEDLRRSEEE